MTRDGEITFRRGPAAVAETDQTHALALERLRSCGGRFLLFTEAEPNTINMIAGVLSKDATSVESREAIRAFLRGCGQGIVGVLEEDL